MQAMTQASNQYHSGANDQAASLNNMSQLSREQMPEGDKSRRLPTQHSLTETTQPTSVATAPSRFEEDLDNNPHSHFLSPVHMYESWDDSDDDDDDDYQFDAGITDFALFSDDYKRAQETNEPLSDKWNEFVADQTHCYNRTVARTRAEVTTRSAVPFYSGSTFAQPEAVPSLTPDTSPRLADDLDFDSAEDSTSSLPYRTKVVTPDFARPASAPINIPRSKQTLSTLSESAIDDEESDDPAAPAFLSYHRNQRAERRRQPSQPQAPPLRPGLSPGNRTLSGKLHVWKRPSWDLFSVEEDKDEDAAQDDSRGRRPDGALRKKKGRAELRG